MSRIGNKEIIYSEDVQVVMDGNIVKVKGPKGSLERTIPEGITINIDSGKINVKRNSKEKKFLSILGEEIGLLFQLADDFLDIRGSKKLVGKPIKKDNKKGKSTLINLMGYEKAHNYANNLKKKILLKLKKHGKNANELKKTVKFILERSF